MKKIKRGRRFFDSFSRRWNLDGSTRWVEKWSILPDGGHLLPFVSRVLRRVTSGQNDGPDPQSSLLANQLSPQHPAAGFCLTHKAISIMLRPQKSDFLSPHLYKSNLYPSHFSIIIMGNGGRVWLRDKFQIEIRYLFLFNVRIPHTAALPANRKL